MMDEVVFESEMCETCGEPLFLDKEECKEFIEKKMKNGFILCSCCGAKSQQS